MVLDTMIMNILCRTSLILDYLRAVYEQGKGVLHRLEAIEKRLTTLEVRGYSHTDEGSEE